jgi:hypothetical protein
MNPYANEDLMWQRLKDIQREMENSRLYGAHRPSFGALARRLGARVWWLAGLATRRPPRRRWVDVDQDHDSVASHVA